MLAGIVQIIGLVGLIVSLILLAWQTRRLTEQTQTGNAIAKAELNNNAICLLHGAWRLIVDQPALRPYFYDRKPCPPNDADRAKALMIAEMAADAASYAVLVAGLLPKEPGFGDWRDTARFIVGQPIVREVVESHREWWPSLVPFLAPTGDD